VDENVTNIEAIKLSKMIFGMWLDAYSDNGAIWWKSHQAVTSAMAAQPDDVVEDATELARKRWKKMTHD